MRVRVCVCCDVSSRHHIQHGVTEKEIREMTQYSGYISRYCAARCCVVWCQCGACVVPGCADGAGKVCVQYRAVRGRCITI